MCIECIINGKTVGNQIDLAREVGGPEKIKFLEMYGEKYCLEPEMCLCPVDFEATGREAQMKVTFHGYDDNYMGEVELTK